MSGSPVLKILYGPPGTGKTYRAAREAVRLIDGTVDPSTVMQRYRLLIDAGRIWPVTFHPSYSYEDFVEGFRPKLKKGQVVYRVVDGPFKKACARCRQTTGIEVLKVGQRIGKGKEGRYEVVAVTPSGAALRSENTRKDANTEFIEQYADLWTIQRLKERGIPPGSLSLAGTRNEERQRVAEATLLPTTVLTGSSHIRALYEALEDARASSQEGQSVVMVIDEINRADLSRVFGELLTLIESDKREGAPEERKVFLPYSQTWFSVPRGLSIIGTMNTADRSLAVMDLALRRRFAFEEIAPEPEQCPQDHGGINVRRLLERWNERITTLRSREHRVGHAELMEERLKSVATEAGWNDDADGRRRAVAWTLRRKVLPLLLEYFHEDWRKAQKTLGAPGLMEEHKPSDGTDYYADVMDVSGTSSFHLPDWWNPESPQWDSEKFAASMKKAQGDMQP